jgi:N-methylhydantoinase A
MEAALRTVSVERGEDPRTAALVAYGGAGGLHACALAAALGARAVVWPRHAGVLCALGALEGGARRERSRSVLLDARELAGLERHFRALERTVLASFAADERATAMLERHAEVRYRGQAHELSVPAAPLAGLAARFHRAHERRFGFADPGRDVEVVTLDVRGACPAADAPGRNDAVRRAGPLRRTEVFDAGRSVPARVRGRAELGTGATLAGPAVVLDEGATLWIPDGWRGRVHRTGAVVLTRSAR